MALVGLSAYTCIAVCDPRMQGLNENEKKRGNSFKRPPSNIVLYSRCRAMSRRNNLWICKRDTLLVVGRILSRAKGKKTLSFFFFSNFA